MNKANTEIRRAAKRAGVSLGDIAAACGCDEQKLTKWLREGLPANMKARIMEYIEKRGENQQKEM